MPKTISILSRVFNSGLIKIFFTCTSILLITTFFFLQFKRELSSEPIKKLTTEDEIINDKIIKDTIKKAIVIKAGLFIENFTTFNIPDEKFVLDMVVWFEFDKNKIETELIGKFSIEDGYIEKKSSPIVTENEKTTIIKYHISVNLRLPLDFHQFPFNDHRINLKIHNRHMKPEEFTLITKKTFCTFSETFFMPDWKIKRIEGEHMIDAMHGFVTYDIGGEVKDRNDFFPAVLFSFTMSNTGWFGIIMLLLPLFILLYLSILCLMADVNSFFRLSGTAGFLTTIFLSYRFNTAAYTPKLGYATLADWIFSIIAIISSLLLAYQFIIHRTFIVKSIEVNESKKKKMYKKILKIDSIIFFSVQLLVIGIVAFLFFA
jgi:hypothetical protein